MLYCNNDFDTVQRCANHHSLVAVGPVSSCCSWAVTFVLEAKRSDLRRLPMVSHAQKCHPTFFIFSNKNVIKWYVHFLAGFFQICNTCFQSCHFRYSSTHILMFNFDKTNTYLGNFNILHIFCHTYLTHVYLTLYLILYAT